jgi:hypothetical protein
VIRTATTLLAARKLAASVRRCRWSGLLAPPSSRLVLLFLSCLPGRSSVGEGPAVRLCGAARGPAVARRAGRVAPSRFLRLTGGPPTLARGRAVAAPSGSRTRPCDVHQRSFVNWPTWPRPKHQRSVALAALKESRSVPVQQNGGFPTRPLASMPVSPRPAAFAGPPPRSTVAWVLLCLRRGGAAASMPRGGSTPKPPYSPRPYGAVHCRTP